MLLLSKHINTVLFNNIKRSFMTKSCDLMCTQINKIAQQNTDSKEEFVSIFKSPNITLFVGMNKLKKYQTITTICLIPTSFGLNMFGHLNLNEVIYVSLMSFSLTAGLYIITRFLSNNLVVFAYLSQDELKCRMSYISFWGDRKELYCNIEDIEPIKYSKLNLLNNKIKLKGSKRVYKIIINNDAVILNNAKCRKVFGNDVM